MSWKVKTKCWIDRRFVKQQHLPGPPPGLCFGGGMEAMTHLYPDLDQYDA